MKLRKLLLFLLIVFSPTQLSVNFWPEWSTPFGVRVDYLSPAIFATDFLLVLFLIFSIKKILSKELVVYSLLFLLFAVINSYFSQLPLLSAYRFLRLYLLGLLFVAVAKSVDDYKDIKAPAIVLSGLMLVTISWLQFIKGSSIGGLMYYLGERPLSTSFSGIQLSNWLGRLTLSPYATTPHPNILAGYMTMGILYFTNVNLKPWRKVFLLLPLTVIFLTQSISALLALLVGLFFSSKKYINLTVTVLLFAPLILWLIPVNEKMLDLPKSINERIILSERAKELFLQYPIFGSGFGTFTFATSKNASFDTGRYWLQPVHNFLGLTLSEASFGFLIFAALIFTLVRKTTPYALKLIVATLTIGMFDHYFLTLNQPMLVLVLLLALSSHEEKEVLHKSESSL